MDSSPNTDSNSDSDQSIPAWADITDDLFLKIYSSLDFRIDRIRFRSICKPWRSSTPKPYPSPNPNLVYFQIPSHDRPIRKRPSFLVQSEIYHLFDPSRRSFVSSVVAVEEGKNRKMKAWHPIADKKLSNCRKVLDLTNIGVVQVGKLFHLKCRSSDDSEFVYCQRVVASLSDHDNDVAERSKIVRGESMSLGVKRLIRDGKNLSLWEKRSSLLRFNNVCVVGIFKERLMSFRLGESTDWKTIVHGGPRFPYSDVIYRKGKFYAVDESRRLVIVDKLMNVEVVNSPDVLSAGLMSNSDTSYLVNIIDELHLILLFYGEEEDIRDPFNTKFLIYRFMEVDRDWVRVMNLEDQAIFVSQCGSFSIRTSDVSSFKKNCIYFQMDIHTECSSFEKGNVCFTSVFDVAKGCCDDFATDFNSPGSVIT